jgi:hypothetical protein
MAKLPPEYQRLIALGIDSSANLPDLNNMTDRGTNPLKPWTASKTVGTMKLIRDYNITDEETFVEKFQEHSKIPLEKLTEQVYQHQLKYFGNYKYDKDTIFKYSYCCVVLNSLQGNSTEKKFDSWAKSNNIMLDSPRSVFDEVFHTDRIEVNSKGKPTALISIKPESFRHNFMQYEDVFAGLQYLSEKNNIPWKIYYRNGDSFSLISFSTLSVENQKKVKKLAKGYRN